MGDVGLTPLAVRREQAIRWYRENTPQIETSEPSPEDSFNFKSDEQRDELIRAIRSIAASVRAITNSVAYDQRRSRLT